MVNTKANKEHIGELGEIIQQLKDLVNKLNLNEFDIIPIDLEVQDKNQCDTHSDVEDILKKYKDKDLKDLKEKLRKIKGIQDNLQGNIENTNKILSKIAEGICGIKIILENEAFQKSYCKVHNEIKTQYQAIQKSLVEKIKDTNAYKGTSNSEEFPGHWTKNNDTNNNNEDDSKINAEIINWFFNEILEFSYPALLPLKAEKKIPSIEWQKILECMQSISTEEYKETPEDDEKDIFDSLEVNEEDKAKIIQQYHEIKKQIYKKRKEEITEENKEERAREIYDWATNKKNSQEKPIITDEKFLTEAICMMDQAYRISTGKHRLKKTQIIAFLAFMQSDDKCKSRLCEILTGEGKTTIVSLLAVITSLFGKKVDIITSNPVLAKKGVEEKELFYNLFGLSFAHNIDISSNVSRENNPYTADILYGTISSFHFDYLRHYFKLEDVRADRPLDFIILDEVDNILVDNGSHSTRISEPMSGLDSLKYRYLNIWLSLKKALESFSSEDIEKYQEYARHNSFNFDVKNKKSPHYDFLEKIIDKTKEEYTIHTENLPQITPNFLEKYVNKQQQEEIWIKNAITAAFHYDEKRHYIIAEEKGYKCIQPVDSCNTGITLNNTILSDGLHQFLQIKHNLYLTVENLESNYISNIDYVDLYSNIFGLTGTLGSKKEQEFLKTCYQKHNLKFAKIPPSRKKRFEGPPRYCIAKDEESWVQEIINRIIKVTKNNLEDLEFTDCKAMEEIDSKGLLEGGQGAQNQKGQPILVVFEFIEEAQFIYEKLLELGCENVILCDNEETAKNVEREGLKPGSIVIATNIAGRGTDFKVDDTVDELGGLHVCLTFLPCNERIENQAFGRTARNGNKGSGELIINKDTLPESIQSIINKEFSNNLSENYITLDQPVVQQVNHKRNEIEKARIEDLQKEQLTKIKKDYNKFRAFCSEMPAIRAKYPTYIVKDIEMRFAFFIKNSLPGNDCDDIDSFIDGCLQETSNNYSFFNPYYAVNHANYLIEIGEQEKAIELLKKITNSSNYKPLYQAHMKLFEATLQKFSGLWAQLNKIHVMGSVMKALGINEIDEDQYEKDVKDSKYHLEQAQKYIEIETSIIAHFEKEDIFFIEEETQQAPLLDSVFFKEMILKEIYLENINSLLEDIKRHEADKKKFYLSAANKIGEIEATSSYAIINRLSLKEIEASGLDNIYVLEQCKEIEDIVAANQDSINVMIIDLEIAISLLVIGFIFPVSGMSVFAVNRIVDVFMDFIMLVVFEQASASSVVDKLKDYGFAILSFGINKLLKCQKFLSKSLKLVQKLTDKFRNSKYFKTFCSGLAKITEKIGNKLEKLIKSAKVVEKRASLLRIAKNRLTDRVQTDIIQGQLKNKFLIWVNNELESWLKGKITPVIEKAIPEGIEQGCNAFINKCQNQIDNIIVAIGEKFESHLIEDTKSNKQEAMQKEIDGEIAKINTLDKFIEYLPKFYNNLKDTINNVIFEVTKGYHILVQLYTQIKSLFTNNLFAVIVKQIRDFFDETKSAEQKARILDNLWENLKSVVNMIEDGIKQVTDNIKKAWNFINDGIEEVLGNILIKIQPLIKEFKNLIKAATKIANDSWEDIVKPVILRIKNYLTEKIKHFCRNNPIVKYLKNNFEIDLWAENINIRESIAKNMVDLLFKMIKKGYNSFKKIISNETAISSTPSLVKPDCTFKALAVFFGFSQEYIASNFSEIACKISNETGYFLGPNGASIEDVKCIIEILLDKNKDITIQQSISEKKPFPEKAQSFLLKYSSASGKPIEGIGFFTGHNNHAMNITSEEPHIKQYDERERQIAPTSHADLEKYQESTFMTVTPYYSSRNIGYKRINSNNLEAKYKRAFITGKGKGELFAGRPESSEILIRERSNPLNKIAADILSMAYDYHHTSIPKLTPVTDKPLDGIVILGTNSNSIPKEKDFGNNKKYQNKIVFKIVEIPTTKVSVGKVKVFWKEKVSGLDLQLTHYEFIENLGTQDYTLDRNETLDKETPEGAKKFQFIKDKCNYKLSEEQILKIATKFTDEIDYDTVAVTIKNHILYIACNYKKREEIGSYINFGFDSELRAYIVKNLKIPEEFPGNIPGFYFKKIHFITSVPKATNAEDNAKPHAEMQLVKHLGGANIEYIGVTKACCATCKKILEFNNIEFPDFEKPNNDPQNWQWPKQIDTELEQEFELKIPFGYCASVKHRL